MAVSPECQLHGVGREVMLAVLGFVEVTDQGGIWCAARASAVGFYEKFCFKVVSGPYEEPGIGQHVRMERHGSWGAGIRGEWAESGEQGRE